MADTIIAGALLLLAAIVILVGVLTLLLLGLARAANYRMPTPDAVSAADLDPQSPVRARTTQPALRVHLCASCGTHGVPRPGEWCMPCVYRTSPVHRAEEILAEAARRADAS